MPHINKNIVLVFLVIVLLWVLFRPYTVSAESFDASTSEFVPVGEQRYGLRGDPLRASSIDNWYISPNRQIMLSDSSGEMWQANGTPPSFGIKDCRKVACPHNGEYDKNDTCWKCGNDCPTKARLPDLWPHVPN